MSSSESKLIGLIGYPLGHSFSNKFFNEKFDREGLTGYQHRNFELESIARLPQLINENPDLIGLNVTIPHKINVIPYLDSVDEAARKIGAVNTIKINEGIRTGYNTDYYGFRQSLEQWVGDKLDGVNNALILGTGGASRAIYVALEDLSIQIRYVSRTPSADGLTYDQLLADPSVMESYPLIINCTPLGTYPNVDQKPLLPYEELGQGHWLYDLVYNPAETAFLLEGKKRGAQTKNGLQMLHLQAEKSWEIWHGAD